MPTIIITCAITLVLIMTTTVAFGWSYDGAEIWLLMVAVFVITFAVQKVFSRRRER